MVGRGRQASPGRTSSSKHSLWPQQHPMHRACSSRGLPMLQLVVGDTAHKLHYSLGATSLKATYEGAQSTRAVGRA